MTGREADEGQKPEDGPTQANKSKTCETGQNPIKIVGKKSKDRKCEAKYDKQGKNLHNKTGNNKLKTQNRDRKV